MVVVVAGALADTRRTPTASVKKYNHPKGAPDADLIFGSSTNASNRFEFNTDAFVGVRGICYLTLYVLGNKKGILSEGRVRLRIETFARDVSKPTMFQIQIKIFKIEVWRCSTKRIYLFFEKRLKIK